MSGYGGSAGSGYGGYGAGDSYSQPSGYAGGASSYGAAAGAYGAPPSGGYGGYDQYAAGSGAGAGYSDPYAAAGSGGSSGYAGATSYGSASYGGGSSYDSRSGSVKGAGVQLCADFQRGRCMRDNCRYVHDPSTSASAQVCNDFLRGRCMRESCRFLHQAPVGSVTSGYPVPYQQPAAYQQPPPQSSYGYGASSGSSSSYAAGSSVQKCADFARGRCMRSNCRFVHDTAAGAPRNPSPPPRICSAFLTRPPSTSAAAYLAASAPSYGGYASSSASLPDAPVCKDFQNGRSVT